METNQLQEDKYLNRTNKYNKNNPTTNSIIIFRSNDSLFINTLPRCIYNEAKTKLGNFYDKDSNQIKIPTLKEYESLTNISTSLGNELCFFSKNSSTMGNNIFNQAIENNMFRNLYNELINMVNTQDLKSLTGHLAQNSYKSLYLSIDLDCKFKDFLNNDEQTSNLNLLKYGNKSLLEIINSININEKNSVINNFIEQHNKEKQEYEHYKIALIRENWREMKNPSRIESVIKITNAANINYIYTKSSPEFKQKILDELIRYSGSLVAHDEIGDYFKRINLNNELADKFTNKYTEIAINNYFDDLKQQISNFCNKKFYQSFEYFNNNFKLMINNDIGQNAFNQIVKNLDIDKINSLKAMLKPEIILKFKEKRLEITENQEEKNLIAKELKTSIKTNNSKNIGYER